ncbi:MAG TPA: hypothetical protein VM581_03080 [Magnetospirillaceae bacterium]|nr:hypothetical protein [Magnetospirillaceae bacterium]
MKKPVIKKQVVWGVIAAAGLLVVVAAWYFMQPMERVRAISCERVTAGTIGSCARIIQTYNRTGLLETYHVEFTPTSDGEFHEYGRLIRQPLDARCGIEFVSASWTAEAFIITTQSDVAACRVERSVIGSWL